MTTSAALTPVAPTKGFSRTGRSNRNERGNSLGQNGTAGLNASTGRLYMPI
jgi:hypothetical protein